MTAETLHKSRILIVDDETANLDALARVIEREGWLASQASSAAQALQMLRQLEVHLVITDLKMPGGDGFEVLREVKRLAPAVEVIVVTAHGTIETAVAAMKEGAHDFITKPFDRMLITRQIHKALEKSRLVRENQRLKQELALFKSNATIIGGSDAIRQLTAQIEQAATSDATVLVLGESGTGKELVANALHMQSRRNQRPFVKVSCTTIPDNLLEAELFGYEKGAFTGAHARRTGRFEAADGGTVFLDEIGDLPLALQGKLLRVLQEGAFERLGSNKTLKVDVRVVAATNRDLAAAIRQQHFREDLYYRLNVIQIRLPALRERRGDIPALATHFMQRYSVKNSKSFQQISAAAQQLLMDYAWPGNVRELENTIERAVVFGAGPTLQPSDLPPLDGPPLGMQVAPQLMEANLRIPLGTPLHEVERQVIEATLAQTGGDKVKAAKLLGIASRTIYRKI